MSRLEKLRAMLAAEPEDPFLRYGLALELEKHGQHEESLGLLHGLMGDSHPYVPAFFMAGQQLARLDRLQESRSVIEQGIRQADRQGQEHAAQEMRQFLEDLAD